MDPAKENKKQYKYQSMPADSVKIINRMKIRTQQVWMVFPSFLKKKKRASNMT
jgi:hypothetical protein